MESFEAAPEIGTPDEGKGQPEIPPFVPFIPEKAPEGGNGKGGKRAPANPFAWINPDDLDGLDNDKVGKIIIIRLPICRGRVASALNGSHLS